MVKSLIFDAGPIINFAMNGMLNVLEDLQKEFKGDFLITKEVKEEIIDRPLTIDRFEFQAFQIQELFKKGVIKHAEIDSKQVIELKRIRDEYMKVANSTFKTKKKYVHLIDKGEAAALALSSILDYVPLVVDERTTRVLCENPQNLRKLLEKKLHTSVKAHAENYFKFEKFKIIRSTELVYIAYKKGLLGIKDKGILKAALYGVKFKGCSVSDKEIKEVASWGKKG
jgi:predicted nucleic acid-binding protein